MIGCGATVLMPGCGRGFPEFGQKLRNATASNDSYVKRAFALQDAARLKLFIRKYYVANSNESRKFEKTGVVKELRTRQAFTKPSVVKRQQKLKAIYIQQLQQEED